ncbi:hypothetical protein ABZ816_17210 [Actinosynnema sp. NPDC047251]|nr:hypothetical protein [Saccharothrix espanaensis]
MTDEERETKPVHIRDVPVDVIEVLQRRAGRAGMSLTSYLRHTFAEMAARPTMEEWVERATDRSWGVRREAILDAVREIRAGVDEK